MSSVFDPTAFMNSQVQGANDTQFHPCPAGEYPATIEEVTPREWTARDGSGKSGVALDVVWSVDSPAVREELGRDKVTVKQGVMLDLTAAGSLDTGTGKNVNLGRLREAVGLNDPSQAFSFSMLPGKVARVKVIHEPYKDTIFAKVTAVSRM